MPRNTEVFAPTFKGTGVVRSADITKDPRYGHNPPHHGMPRGHLPVRSYLAVPVKGAVRRGDRRAVLRPLRTSAASREHHERLAVGIASWASVALENARLYTERAGGEPHQGRLPGEPLARAADAAERDPRLRAHAARRHRRRRTSSSKAIDTIERNADVADADRRGRARRLAHRLGQDSAERPAGRLARRSSASAIDAITPAADAKGVRHRDRARSATRRRSRAIRNGCSRCCGTCCRTRSSSPTAAAGCRSRLERVNSHVEVVGQRHRHRHLAGIPAARVRALPPSSKDGPRATSFGDSLQNTIKSGKLSCLTQSRGPMSVVVQNAKNSH